MRHFISVFHKHQKNANVAHLMDHVSSIDPMNSTRAIHVFLSKQLTYFSIIRQQFKAKFLPTK